MHLKIVDKFDRKKFSLLFGSHELIVTAREKLQQMPGGMDLLLGLLNFNPMERTTALQALNSEFMMSLIDANYDEQNDIVYSCMAYFFNC